MAGTKCPGANKGSDCTKELADLVRDYTQVIGDARLGVAGEARVGGGVRNKVGGECKSRCIGAGRWSMRGHLEEGCRWIRGHQMTGSSTCSTGSS